MTAELDLSFRPETYFGPQRLEQYLISKIKGAFLKTKLEALFREGRHSEVNDLIGTAGISENDRKALEAVHPMFMGGNYLPDTEEGEIEIARIRIDSTTSDVTCIYARPDRGAIHYRVVDEYDGAVGGPPKTEAPPWITARDRAARGSGPQHVGRRQRAESPAPLSTTIGGSGSP